MNTYAIILASGTGNRFGGELPKQFSKIGEKTIFERTVEIFEGVNEIDGIILVITPNYIDFARDLVAKNGYKKSQKLLLRNIFLMVKIYMIIKFGVLMEKQCIFNFYQKDKMD